MIKRSLEVLWAIRGEVLIYPAVVIVGSFFYPLVVRIFGLLGTDPKWYASSCSLPVVALIASFSTMSDLLNPKGLRKAILTWPSYAGYRSVVQSSIALYVLALFMMATGAYVVVASHRPFGLLVMVGAASQTAFTFTTLHLASWKSREILTE